MYMNAWRRVKLLHFAAHARYKIPNASQAHAASNMGDRLVFPRNHRAFPSAWLGCMFCLPQIPSAASQSHDLLQGLLGSALTQWPWHLWPVAALLGKALTNTSGSSHFPPNCPRSFRVFFFQVDAYYKLFSIPISHHELPHSYNHFVQCFPLVMTKAHYLHTQHRPFYLQSLTLFLLEIRLKSLETATGAAKEQLLSCCSGEPLFTQR